MTIIARPSEWTWPRSDPSQGASREQRHQLYFAFISYSHADEAAASWLHESLERFRVPKFLVGKLTEQGPIPARLSPIFRDLKELPAAGDLGNEIRTALANSRCLIVLCSPTAATSKWTNREIEAFRLAHPDGCLLAAVLSGKPFASEIAGEEADECLPPALRVAYDKLGRPTRKRAEPLCADLRGGSEDRRIGFLKLVAGMLGIGLDDLVQRDTLRRHRRMAAVAAGSMLGMLVMTGLAVTAIQAGDTAREQRREAEGLVEFMVGDLRTRLEPIGRLDVLDSVAKRALAYYETSDPGDLSDEGLIQRSKALTLMGEIANSRGDLETALRFYRQAFAQTKAALERQSDDPQHMFDHAQNVFWVGYIDWQRGNLENAEAAFREYDRLAKAMVAAEPTNTKWLLERSYANNSLGVVQLEHARYDDASRSFGEALQVSQGLTAISPDDAIFQDRLVESIAWLAEARDRSGALSEALDLRRRQLATVTGYQKQRPEDSRLKLQALVARRKLAQAQASLGETREALANLQVSANLADQMLRQDPQNRDWAQFAAITHLDRSQLLRSVGEFAEAARALKTGCAISSDLQSQDTTVLVWRVELPGRCLAEQSRLALSQGRGAEGREYAARFSRLARSEQQKKPSLQNALLLAEAELIRGDAEAADGRAAEARRAWRAAEAAWPAGIALSPRDAAVRAALMQRLGRSGEAGRIRQRLASLGFRHPAFRMT